MKSMVCCSAILFATFPLTQPGAASIEYERGFFGGTVVKGATLHSANGFYFDSNDQIHMANLLSHETTKAIYGWPTGQPASFGK